MEFKRAICPSCGGDLQLPPDRKTASCLYCSGQVVVREAINAAAQKAVPNLLSLAHAAQQARNFNEAYQYYTLALEYDADDNRAWLGKALAAGEMSTAEASRIPEMIVGMQNALRVTTENDKGRFREELTVALVPFADRFLKLCRDHRDKTIEWANYLNRCSEILKALEFAYNVSPDKKPIVERILAILEENRASYKSRRLGVTSEFWVERENWLKYYRERLRELTPPSPLPAELTTRTPIDLGDLKAVWIIGGLVLGGFVLFMLFVAIVSSGNPPSSSVNQPISAETPQASPSIAPRASPVPTVDEEALARKKAAADVASYVKQLRAVGIDNSFIVNAKTGITPDTLKITVSNGWHYEPYQMRFQAAQKLWETWAEQHSPHDPDKSRISLVDLNGNEVGGSRAWAGSLIWVQEN
ncbi:MAG TPA: hypothetical protein VE135_10875 [Pyrinomonadaceae bacterium]|nr:hypothetical protein [Pyrinomonadaceae bacterium]